MISFIYGSWECSKCYCLFFYAEALELHEMTCTD